MTVRVLVTGAAGQVGQDLIAVLDGEYEVHGSDVAPRPKGLAPGAKWHDLDITDAERIRELLAELRPHRVFHLAAILSARGEEMPQRTYAVNQTGTAYLLEACREFEVSQVVFASTIAVFGPLPGADTAAASLPDPVPDDIALHPTTMYGVTKVAGELLGEYYWRRFKLDFRGVRFPGLISAVRPGGGTSDYALYMYVDAIRRGRYQAFCRPDTRIPLMYMPDGIRALVELSDAPRTDLRRCVYNIAAFSPTAEEIAASVMRELPDAKIDFRPDPMRQGILDSWPRSLDDSMARTDWGWQPSFDLDAMTKDLIPKVRALVEQDPSAF